MKMFKEFRFQTTRFILKKLLKDNFHFKKEEDCD